MCVRCSVRLLFWRQGNHLFIIRPYEYNLDLPCVMSFLLVPHFPRLIGWDRIMAVADTQTVQQFIYWSRWQDLPYFYNSCSKKIKSDFSHNISCHIYLTSTTVVNNKKKFFIMM